MFYYIWVSFLSAFLIFQIQPIVGRYILPWFGGTPAVWSTSLLFFQVLLLAGYGYAYWLSSSLKPRRQASLHLVLLGVSVSLLFAAWYARQSRVMPPAVSLASISGMPVRSLLTILLFSVGIPYFTLATTSPLIQSWYSRAKPGRSPYALYAWSNAGSLIGLISYPFLVEPALTLRTQGVAWSLVFLLFVASMGCGASRLLRRQGDGLANEDRSADAPPQPLCADHLMWIALSGCASLLLLATTRQICQEVAVVPFLWILPLVLYLLSFILCFSNVRWYARGWYISALVVSSGIFCWVLVQDFALGIVTQITAYSVAFFICCMICHGELYMIRPHPRFLTSFYLTVSTGGALGGAFVALVAPRVFSGFWELPLGLLLCWVLLLISNFKKPAGGARRPAFLTVALLVGGIAFIGFFFFVYINLLSRETLAAYRNFYGVLRVRETGAGNPGGRAYTLLHGATNHGFQLQQEERRREPTAYYTRDSGIGLVVRHHPRRASGLRIGMLGLGIGTLTAYGTPHDTFRIYEINPDVIRLAEGTGGFFTFVRDSRAAVEIVPGDARISLASELEHAQSQNFDLLVIDAFNSDSVPIHLLTREAFELYLAHMRPEGIVTVNITNKHLDLWPVVHRLAEHFGLRAELIRNDRYDDLSLPSVWAIMSRDAGLWGQPGIAARLAPVEKVKSISLWTDDYSNLFQILK